MVEAMWRQARRREWAVIRVSSRRRPHAGWRCRLALLCGIPAVCLAGLAPALAAEPEAAAVAATVDGQPIYVHQVEGELARALGHRHVAPEARPYWLAKTLQQLIDRELVLHWLRRTGQGASPQEVEREVERLARRLRQRGESLEDYCRQRGLQLAELRHTLEWQLAWQRCVARYVTDENLQKHFESHRREFDGTELRVAHILLRVDEGEAKRSVAAAMDEARRIRAQILRGGMSFAEAAQRYSAAPSSRDGGDIGWISRREPMPESFSREAFALEKGGVSEPVATPLGVHLIQCLEVKPGQGTWQDARRLLQESLVQYLFSWAADHERANARVRYTGATPHLKTGTDEVLIRPVDSG